MEKKKKINFSEKRKNALKSLNEVEYFLNKSELISKYLKLYKIIKNNKN